MPAKKEDQDATSSPLIESIDPRQVAAGGLTSTPEEADHRTGDRPDPKDNPAAPNDESEVVDPSDPMTLKPPAR